MGLRVSWGRTGGQAGQATPAMAAPRRSRPRASPTRLSPHPPAQAALKAVLDIHLVGVGVKAGLDEATIGLHPADAIKGGPRRARWAVAGW